MTCQFTNLKLTRRFSQPETLEPVALVKKIPRTLGSPWPFQELVQKYNIISLEYLGIVDKFGALLKNKGSARGIDKMLWNQIAEVRIFRYATKQPTFQHYSLLQGSYGSQSTKEPHSLYLLRGVSSWWRGVIRLNVGWKNSNSYWG